MTWAWRICLCSIAIILPVHATAYEIGTHAEVITRRAVSLSVLKADPSVLRNLGLEKDIADPSQRFSNSAGQARTIDKLLEDGSRFEDLGTRPRRHFYNPRTGQGLNVPVLPIQTGSPDWALAQPGTLSGQDFSYWDARRHLFHALTAQSNAVRENAFGRVFQTLGHVIHHLQDMAQPQHVRNDAHCVDILMCGLTTLGLYYNPSLYEKWSEIVEDSLPTNPLSVGYNINSSQFASVFNSPRSFWNTQPIGGISPIEEKGIAEFTHNNFVSAGTNFLPASTGFVPFPDFPRPTPGLDVEKWQITHPDLLGPNQSLQGEIWFIPTHGTDNFTGLPINNPRASTFSIFSEDLKGRGIYRIVRLNRFTFQNAHQHLIPRAVAFSAGMINYFFRGRMEVRKESQDLGFRIVNLGTETMSGRFALYYDAIDGNRYPVQVDPNDPNRVPNDPNAWFLTISPVDVAQPESNQSEPLFYIPPPEDGSAASPKTPNQYMLVFKGDMGEERADEQSGVIGAVAAKFIPAPGSEGVLYLAALNSSNRYVGLRVDKNGTATIPGGFDPLFGLVQGAFFGQFFVVPKPAMIRQVSFKQALNGWDYRVIAGAVTGTDTSNTGFILDESSGKFVSNNHRGWIAKSPNSSIGNFQFRLTHAGGLVTLSYRRDFVDPLGIARTVSSTIPLPANTLLNQYLLSTFDGGLPVSEDGLHVGDFVGDTTSTYSPPDNPHNFQRVDENKYYELLITLGETPTVELKFLRTLRNTASVARTFKPDTSELLSHSSASHTEIQHTVGYFNGSKESYVISVDSSHIGAGEYASTGNCPGAHSASIFANYSESFVRTDRFKEGSIAYKSTCNHSSGPQQSGDWTWHALTYRANDAVYERPASNLLEIYFRDMLVSPPGTSSYVAAASPIGEVFFAKPDLSVIIHEPAPGGMQKVVLPPNIVKLLAALWL